jgi:hypothetical protein
MSRSPDAALRRCLLCCCLATTSVSETQLPGFLAAATGGHSSVEAASELELLPSAESVNAASPALPIPPKASRRSGVVVSSTNTCLYAPWMPLRSSAEREWWWCSSREGTGSGLFGLGSWRFGALGAEQGLKKLGCALVALAGGLDGDEWVTVRCVGSGALLLHSTEQRGWPME